MHNRERLASKKKSKTESVQSVVGERMADEDIHVGPGDYVAWQKDNKSVLSGCRENFLKMYL